MDGAVFFGTSCQNGLMPALVRPPLASAAQRPALKQFLPFPLDGGSALGLFPGFSAMDPVQKAVLNHTLGLSSCPKKKHVSCSVCQLRFNSQSQAVAHYKGTKHAKKLKALDSPKTKSKGLPFVAKETSNQEPASPPPSLVSAVDSRDVAPASCPLLSAPAAPTASVAPVPMCTPFPDRPPSEPFPSDPDLDPGVESEVGPGETEEEKARRLLYCSLCKVAVNSASQLDAHNSGTKHKTMLEARSGLGSIKSFPRAGVKSRLAPGPCSVTGLQNKTFFCEICDVHVNSETQLKQHISSRRHKDRAAGKPAKPKYSPYSKPQKGQGRQPVKLSLGKDVPPLTSPPLLPAHLAAVAAAVAMGNTFPHKSPAPSSPATLFQNPPLTASLLRPAPGPVRTSHATQVLFAPY